MLVSHYILLCACNFTNLERYDVAVGLHSAMVSSGCFCALPAAILGTHQQTETPKGYRTELGARRSGCSG